ncbi:MAG: adenylosuccinate lyase [Nitrososphaerota archaeon]|nr:adenylosuccinate lyase [Nitrososphaerota archaeon]
MTKNEDPAYSQLFSPTDFRYTVDDLKPILSEEAYVKYKARVEAMLAKQFAKVGICSRPIAEEIARSCELVSAKEVYAEESRIKHDIRALANVIRSRVSDSAKPYVHLAATSYDVVDTANALRLKEATKRVIIPDLVNLENALIEIALKYDSSVQIGRTHGQHAEPITFGFFISYYVSRLGQRILKINAAADSLTGKFAGAVGVYGPLSLVLTDPEKFENDLLASLDLTPSEVSTQIVQPEPLTDLIHSIVSTFGVLANFARDLRNLQRTEIAEVSEEFLEMQVGSSTMPQKRNPINFENIESTWKKFMPQMVTVYMDQISEHQRDLTNSLSQRYLPELLVAFDSSVRRLTRTIWDGKRARARISIDSDSMKKNFDISADTVSAEPLYILLALAGHPNAHESVRSIVQRGLRENKSFHEILKSDKELSKYLDKIPKDKWSVLNSPSKYTGIASEKARRVALSWKKKMKKLDRLP